MEFKASAMKAYWILVLPPLFWLKKNFHTDASSVAGRFVPTLLPYTLFILQQNYRSLDNMRVAFISKHTYNYSITTSLSENVTGYDSGGLNIALRYSAAELYFEVLI